MTPICATFSDFRLVKGRKVCQLVCEVPLEQADAALAALGGLPNPHAERWVGIVPLKAQPQGQDNSGSAPSPSLADAADSPAAAPMSPLHKAIAHLYEDGGSTEREAEFYPSDPRPARQTLQAQARGATEPATKPKKHWDELKPSQQAAIAGQRADFHGWLWDAGPSARWDGQRVVDATEFVTPAAYIRWYCGVSSRSDLDTNPEAAKRWRELHSMFTADTQYGDRR
jgi:hypothetical protein